MNMHCNLSRTMATIAGYRQLCAELEAENQALRIQNRELRAQLCGRAGPEFALPETLDGCDADAISFGGSAGQQVLSLGQRRAA